MIKRFIMKINAEFALYTWSCHHIIPEDPVDHCMYLYLDELRNCLTPAGGNGLSEWSSSSKVDELMATISDPSPIIIVWPCHLHTELLMLKFN